MSNVRLCLIVLAMVALAGWCYAGTDVPCHPSGQSVMRVEGSVLNLSGDRIALTESGVDVKNGTLRSADGKLEAKAEHMLMSNVKTQNGGFTWETDLAGRVSLVLQVGHGSKIEASAAKARIDWQNQVIELLEDVSVTSVCAESGKALLPTVRGDSARILMTETLGKGQARISITDSTFRWGVTENSQNPPQIN